MVNIDTVYQRVLAFANKEQRGYITPQEFNLFANQAQMEIFEQYFYDINQYNRIPGNDTEYSDTLNLLNEKIRIFEVEGGATGFLATVSGAMQIPDEIYKLGTVRVGSAQVEMLTSKEFDVARLSPLTAPTLTRPIGYLTQRGLYIATGASTFVHTGNTTNLINLSYITRPTDVAWGYFVISDKALYDSGVGRTTHFELHQAEETELVYKILKFAGVAMRREDIMKVGQGLESAEVQKQKQ